MIRSDKLLIKISSVDKLNELKKGTVIDNLGIEFTRVGNDWLEAKMPVDYRTLSPYGLLHGGISLALAETLGSIAANSTVRPENQSYVGLDINANHIRSAKEGYVFGIARPLHLGKRTHVWEIKITDEEDKLVCISRITMMSVK